MTFSTESRVSIATFVAMAAIIATAFIYNHWVLDSRMFFYTDDWEWLWRAEYAPWNFTFFSILPSAAYNDRPVGSAFIKALYELVGLNYRPFSIVMLSLHAVNCVLLYTIAARYTGRGGSSLAALLAAVWFSANTAAVWLAAIFDLLGATLCLLTVLLRQLAIKSGNSIRYDLAGAACYLLAIRTKEFALGTVALLFVMNVLVERQTVRATIKQLVPYLVVFVIYAVRYAQLLATEGPPIGDPYHLDISVQSIVANLGFYVRALFYGEPVVDPIIIAGLIVVLGAGMFFAEDKAQRTAVFGIAGFVIMLGPALLLPQHQDGLYLYTPHFFFALVIGALFSKRMIATAVAVAAAAAIAVAPTAIYPRKHAINFFLAKGEANQPTFKSAVKLLTPLPPGATVFISGVEPYFNPFSSGSSLRTAFKDSNLKVEVEKPEAELIAKFCATTGARRFLRFEGTQATDAAGEIEKICNRQKAS